MVTTRRKAKKDKQVSKSPEHFDQLSDTQYIRQFQAIALEGDYESVQNLVENLPDAYYEDQCQRTRAVFDAGHDDIFVLLTRAPAYHVNDPQAEDKRTVLLSVVAFLFFLASAIYGIMNPKPEP
jgi:hypothetical protein